MSKRIQMPSAITVSLDTKLSEIEKVNRLLAHQLDLLYNGTVTQRRILDLVELKRLQLIAEEIRAMAAFEKDQEDELSDTLTNEQLIKILKQHTKE